MREIEKYERVGWFLLLLLDFKENHDGVTEEGEVGWMESEFSDKRNRKGDSFFCFCSLCRTMTKGRNLFNCNCMFVFVCVCEREREMGRGIWE